MGGGDDTTLIITTATQATHEVMASTLEKEKSERKCSGVSPDSCSKCPAAKLFTERHGGGLGPRAARMTCPWAPLPTGLPRVLV